MLAHEALINAQDLFASANLKKLAKEIRTSQRKIQLTCQVQKL